MAKNKTSTMPSRTSATVSNRLGRLVQKPWFGEIYVFVALLILLGSTVLWSLLSARVHSNNADQLVNPYLFDTSSIMHGSLLPGQHTFLLKWPVFFITKFYGETAASYEVATVALSLITVSGLAYVIHRIERRRLVKGTLFLALASVLLVIPAQPYPGGLLPVNMAMIATRNIEYVLYIACAWAIVRTKRLKSNTWLLACAGLTILVASDKLFLTLTLSSALVACIIYALRGRWTLANFSARWFLSAAIAAVGSFILLALINTSKIVHVVGAGSTPYGFINNSHQLAIALLGAFNGLISNFGANPAFGTIRLHDMPSQAMHHILSLGGPILVINGLLLIGGLAASFNLLISSFKDKSRKKDLPSFSDSQKLSLLMLWTSLAAYGAFILTNHYYPVDARYLTIGLFSIFITMATFTRTRHWEGKRLAYIGVILTLAMILSLPMVLRSFRDEKAASSTFDNRNSLIAQALSNHNVNVLVGDYWRVVAIKQIAQPSITVMPMNGCINPRGVLSSLAWQPNLQTNSFAYVLSLDKSQTDYPACNPDVIFSTYGRPNASVVIAGSIEHPKELLLFYDHGAHKSTPQNATPTTITPTIEAISIDDLPNRVCSGPTSMNIVAHQDDDLLFMNPDIKHDINAGSCERTIYITAGDAGSNQFFWLGREQGSEAAYSKMIGNDSIWIQRIVKLTNNQYLTITNPKGNSKISLIFLHLPDGNIYGQGFNATMHESLQKLYQNQISNMHTIYGNSTYSSNDLVNALAELMHAFQPAEIRTQATFESKQYPDHSDHMAVSRFAEKAYENYELTQYNNSVVIPFRHYIGYPIHAMPQNVSNEDLEDKTAAFLSYAKHDGSVCQSVELCAANPAYGSYLRREYTQ